jgi:ribosome-binding protein aMBF1 (putative translation factor)
MDGQDWNPVIVRSTAKKPGAAGGAGGASRGGITEAAARIRRLETEDFPSPTKHLSPESRTEMIRARIAKGMSQVQLNSACAFPLHTIRDIENGKLCPTPAQMNAIKRVLGVVMKYA